ncbi:MAG: glycosyltransferase family 2 protein [Alphaproteobacteria bacterium]
MNTELSIIIPVYNGESSIRNCLDSIFAQSQIDKYEVIVVNDGSTDNTQNILQEYKQNHPNLKIIKKQNGGVSSARNIGIKQSKGKYITFIDADDMVGINPHCIDKYFSKSDLPISKHTNLDIYYKKTYNFPKITITDNYFTELLKCTHKSHPDVVFGGKITFNQDDKYIKCHIYNENLTYDTNLKNKHEMILHADIRENANFALYKRNFLTSHNLHFEPKMPLDEDMLFCMLATFYAESVATTKNALYYYNRHSNSASNFDDVSKTEQKYAMATIQRFSTFLNIISKQNKHQPIYTFWLKEFAKKRNLYTNILPNNFPISTCQTCPNETCHKCPLHKINKKIFIQNIQDYTR